MTEIILTVGVLLIFVGIVYLIQRRTKTKGSLFAGRTTTLTRIFALILGLISVGMLVAELSTGYVHFLWLILSVALIAYSFGADRLLRVLQGPASLHQLLDAVKHDPESVDFTELRMSYSTSPQYDPYHVKGDTLPARKEFADAREHNNPQWIITASEKLLELDPFYIQAHVHAALNYEKVGNKERATYHQKFVKGWWESICQSGDGLSFQTAFTVVNLNEEYVSLDLLQLQKEKQNLKDWSGHIFDVFEVRNQETGDKFNLYFNIDLIHKGVQEDRAQPP